MSDLQNSAGPRIPRYLDLLLCCLVAVLVCCLLHPGLQHIAGWLEDLTAAWPWSIRYPLFGLLAAGVWLPLISMGGFRFSDLAWSSLADLHLPAWIAGILGCAFYIVCAHYYLASPSPEIDWLAAGVLVSGLACAGLYAVLQTPRNKQRAASPATVSAATQSTTFSALLKDEAAFLNWLELETPIEKPQDDLFGMAAMARRITRILTQEPLKTIGIIGPYGCGKSSLVNLVEHYLDNPELFVPASPAESETSTSEPVQASRLLRCRMDTWGVAPGALAEHVLQKIVDEMAKHVDVLSIRNLPQNYRDTMSGTGNPWLNALCGFLGNGHDPEVLFTRLDSILAATGYRLVVFIEDLDRNPDSERMWLEMAALLDRLHDLKKVTFVLSIGQTIKASDVLVRICEHIETFKLFTCHEVKIVVDRFRQICLEQLSFVDLMEYDERKIRLNQTIWFDESKLDNTRTPVDGIASLMTTPRILKTALRRTRCAWKYLSGEVDFDDLLVTCVLRIGAPEAYAFIARNSGNLRHCRELTANKKEENQKILDKELEISINGQFYSKDSVHKLIDFLFPDCVDDNFKQLSIAPQGVVNSYPTDYWSRVNAGAIDDDEIHDQDVLHAIANWRNNPTTSVYKNKILLEAILTEDRFDDKIKQLGNNFTVEEIRRLAHELFVRIGQTKTLSKNTHDLPPGFMQLLMLYQEKNVVKKEHDDWVSDEIALAMPISLQFANTIYYYWRFSEKTLTEEPTPEIRNAMIKRAKELFSGNPSALITALSNGTLYNESAIYNFAVNHSSPKEGGSGFHAREWKWLADTLVDACKIPPVIAVQQLTSFTVRTKTPLPSNDNNAQNIRQDYSFEQELVSSFFDNRLIEVLEILRDFTPTFAIDKNVKSRLFAAKYYSAEFLAKSQETVDVPTTGTTPTSKPT